MIDKDTYLRFCDEALVAMRDIVVDLGDDLANRRPDLPGANSPFAILTHCLGMCAAWASPPAGRRPSTWVRSCRVTATRSSPPRVR